MGRPTKRPARRAEITAAFARVLAERGYAGSTIVAVAEEAGVAPGLVHHYFRDKSDLLESLLKDLVGRFRQRVEARQAGADQLSAYLSAALDLGAGADTVAARCWVGVLAEAVRQPSLSEEVRRLVDAEIEVIRRRSAGRLSAPEAGAMLAFIMGALVLGVFAPKRAAGFAAPTARLMARALQSR